MPPIPQCALVAQWITRQPSRYMKAEDCGFDPHLGYSSLELETILAQLVERRPFIGVAICKPNVAGSTPAGGNFFLQG